MYVLNNTLGAVPTCYFAHTLLTYSFPPSNIMLMLHDNYIHSLQYLQHNTVGRLYIHRHNNYSVCHGRTIIIMNMLVR